MSIRREILLNLLDNGKLSSKKIGIELVVQELNN